MESFKEEPAGNDASPQILRLDRSFGTVISGMLAELGGKTLGSCPKGYMAPKATSEVMNWLTSAGYLAQDPWLGQN